LKRSRKACKIESLDNHLANEETYVLAENLERFLARLRDAANSSVRERHQVLREVLVDSDSWSFDTRFRA
jgi:hypothetical protein